MMNDGIKISVALCTFNGDKYLAAQLQSLIDQSRRPDEIVICDDGSVDGTIELINSYQKKTDVSIKLYVNEASLGVISNFEKAISHCTGDIIFLCDQDDIWYTNKIATMAAILQDDESVSLVASNNRLVDNEGHPIGNRLNWELCGFTHEWQNRVRNGDAFRVFSFHSPISGHAMAFRRSVCPVLLPFPQGYHHDRWVAMICAGVGNVRLISEPLSDYRQHDNNIVGGGNPQPSLLRHVSTTPNLDAAMFVDKVNVYQEAKIRLSRHEQADTHRIVGHLDELIRFNNARQKMRQSSWLRRMVIIGGQVFSGRYWTCGRGLLTVARDIVG